MMCKVIARQSPTRFRKISRSLRIAGHSTTIRLEDAFWDVLDEIAQREGLSTSKLISALHDEALELQDAMSNFASVLRTVCLIYREERVAGRQAPA
jgi:predicted DNA-binding ribbon-helix-helix protein